MVIGRYKEGQEEGRREGGQKERRETKEEHGSGEFLEWWYGWLIWLGRRYSLILWIHSSCGWIIYCSFPLLWNGHYTRPFHVWWQKKKKKNQYLLIASSLSTCPKGFCAALWSLTLWLRNWEVVQNGGTPSGWRHALAGKDSVSCGTEFSKEVRKRSRVRGGGGASRNTGLRYLGSLEKEKRDVCWGVWVGTLTRTRGGRGCRRF